MGFGGERHTRDGQPGRQFFEGLSFDEGRDVLKNGETDRVCVVDTPNSGKGLEAKTPIEVGRSIFCAHGTTVVLLPDEEGSYVTLDEERDKGGIPLHKSSFKNRPDLCLPDSICIGRVGLRQALLDRHLGVNFTPHDWEVLKQYPRQGLYTDANRFLNPDPENPLRYLNHSCDPNARRLGSYAFVAARNIEKGEPITADYSLLETNPDWRMACACGSPNCRHEIRSVQSLLPSQIKFTWDDMPLFMQDIYLESMRDKDLSDDEKAILKKLETIKAVI